MKRRFLLPSALVVTLVATGMLVARPVVAQPDVPVDARSATSLPDSADLTLASVVEAALAHSPDAERLVARSQHADAMADRAQSVLDDAPTVGFSHQTDALGGDTGMREWESSIELPLRRSGLREAARRQAEGQRSVVEGQSAMWRLEVAGRVRDLLARLDAAQAEVTLAGQALATARDLQAQVGKRVEYGDVPRTDRLLAREDTLQREADLRRARLQRDQVVAEYRRFTGLERRPATWREAPSDDTALDQHPALQSARAAMSTAQAGRAVVRERGRLQPTVGFNLRREEDGRDAIDSVGVSLSLPIPLSRLRAPEEARAGIDLADAQASFRQARRDTALAVEQARQALTTARGQLERARDQESLATENLRIQKKAYSLGEIGLVDLLRVQSRHLVAHRQAVMSEIDLKRAIADYNQAKGVMP
ncbi:TolC family protein [Guyparkeria hydrothermalis]|uniref:TolC family protein n=1 Tax=Guyparkeria hydrothermalis TaxID=923 RepID=UPI0020228AF8|nr:TolC family protein [Guyparkeria hydrothermalis]MCL7745287.1 TolC family protein [Guyparkeria hydrothermalis]